MVFEEFNVAAAGMGAILFIIAALSILKGNPDYWASVPKYVQLVVIFGAPLVGYVVTDSMTGQ